MITIEPQGGLANRMRAIDSAVALAGDIDFRVRLIWNIDPNIGCSFRSLFQMPPEICQIKEVNKLSRAYRLRKQLPEILRPRQSVDIDRRLIIKFNAEGFDFTKLKSKERFHVKCDLRFYWSNSTFSFFKPVDGLQRQIDAVTADFDQTIGVHIRRTDNLVAINDSPTELFIEKMRAAVEHNDNTNFFLATDDFQEEQLLRNTFPGRIVTHRKRSLNRRNSNAIEDALIDLYCLAATKRVFASRGSSFSQTAAQISNINIEMICRNPDEVDPHEPA